MQIQKPITEIITPAKEITSNHRSYHGRMTGAAAERVLQDMNEPSYLTRFSANHNKHVLSVLTEDMERELETQHLELAFDNDINRYEIVGAKKKFKNIDDLLSFYECNPLNEAIQSIGVPCVANEAGNRKRMTHRQKKLVEEGNSEIINKLIETFQQSMEKQQKDHQHNFETQQKDHKEEMKLLIESNKRICTVM